MRRLPWIAPLAFLLANAPASVLAEGERDETGVFFREPDFESSVRIRDLISQLATNSVDDRKTRRRALEDFGYWSVDPLIDALQNPKVDPPTRCSSILVLDAIRDRRAVEPLRAAVLREASHPYASGFAALALGRFRDGAALETFRTALKTPKSLDMLKAAVPLALVKIRTADAKDLLLERLRVPAKEPIRNAELLALGFFPETALDGTGGRPGPEIAAGLANRQRRGERQSALLAVLVANRARGVDMKPFLTDLFNADSAPEVQALALLGLSHSPDAEVTELLARTAAKQGDDHVREIALELLVERDPKDVRALLLQIGRNSSAARLRARALLALGRVEDDDARRLIVDRLDDRAPIVRAAAAIALTRRPGAVARETARAVLEAKLRHGDPNDDVRANWETARAVLAGERTDVRWTRVGDETLFSDMSLDYVHRLLREVNLRLMASLDLAKIQNLQGDSEIETMGPPASADVPEHGDPNGGGAGGGSTDPGTPTDSGLPSSDGQLGAMRTSQYQELRDLKVELLRDPYIGLADLPSPPTTPSAPR